VNFVLIPVLVSWRPFNERSEKIAWYERVDIGSPKEAKTVEALEILQGDCVGPVKKVGRNQMLHIVLCEPEIPPNTGNIARLCAATGTTLLLVGRLGFRLDDRSLRRAGLDYWDAVELERHVTFRDFEAAWVEAGRWPERLFCLSKHAPLPYTAAAFRDGDGLVFGGETRGLPPEILSRFGDRALCIPMPTGKVRSLNLATAAGIVLYEALRQLHSW